MKVVVVTDAWLPQVNGVVTTLSNIMKNLPEHEFTVIDPSQFSKRYCGDNLTMPVGQRPQHDNAVICHPI